MRSARYSAAGCSSPGGLIDLNRIRSRVRSTTRSRSTVIVFIVLRRALSCCAMTLRTLIILGALLLGGQCVAPAALATAPSAPGACGPGTGSHGPIDSSSWPALNADAAQSNYNPDTTALTAKNVLKVKARWCAVTAAASYPIVSGGRVFLPVEANGKIHARVFDAATGKPLATYSKDAVGGMLAGNGNLYLAGHTLQAVSLANGQKLFGITGSPRLSLSTFVFPETDGHYLFSGFYSGINSSIYTLDPQSGAVIQRLPSTTAAGTIAGGRVLTNTAGASIIYDAGTGRALARPPYLGSYWFAGSVLGYAVCSAKGKGTSVIALDGTGR